MRLLITNSNFVIITIEAVLDGLVSKESISKSVCAFLCVNKSSDYSSHPKNGGLLSPPKFGNSGSNELTRHRQTKKQKTLLIKAI
jgi:hypothetical protein